MNVALFWHPILGLLLIRVENGEVYYYEPSEPMGEMEAVLYADWLRACQFDFEAERNLN